MSVSSRSSSPQQAPIKPNRSPNSNKSNNHNNNTSNSAESNNSNNNNHETYNRKASPNKSGSSNNFNTFNNSSNPDNLGNNSNSPNKISNTLGSHTNPIPIGEGKKRGRRARKKPRNKPNCKNNQPEINSNPSPSLSFDRQDGPSDKRQRVSSPPSYTHPQSPLLQHPMHFLPAFPPNSPPLPPQQHVPHFQPPQSPVRPNSPPTPHYPHYPPPHHSYDRRNMLELALNPPNAYARPPQLPPHQPYPIPSNNNNNNNNYKNKREFFHPNRPPSEYQHKSKIQRANPPPHMHVPSYPPSPSYSPAFSPPYQYVPLSPLPSPSYSPYNTSPYPNVPATFEHTNNNNVINSHYNLSHNSYDARTDNSHANNIFTNNYTNTNNNTESNTYSNNSHTNYTNNTHANNIHTNNLNSNTHTNNNNFNNDTEHRASKPNQNKTSKSNYNKANNNKPNYKQSKGPYQTKLQRLKSERYFKPKQQNTQRTRKNNNNKSNKDNNTTSSSSTSATITTTTTTTTTDIIASPIQTDSPVQHSESPPSVSNGELLVLQNIANDISTPLTPSNTSKSNFQTTISPPPTPTAPELTSFIFIPPNITQLQQQITDTSSNSSTDHEFSLPLQPISFKRKAKSLPYEATATSNLRAKYGPNTISVCNLPSLSIPTIETQLREFFSAFGSVSFLRAIAQEKPVKGTHEKVAKGTAYVTFDTHLAVESAMKETLKISGHYCSMKDLDTGQVSAHLDPSRRSAIQAITRELFVKLNHKENQHKLFRLDNVCYGITHRGEGGTTQKASAVIKDTYGSLGIYLLTEPFSSIFAVNDKTRTIDCNHSLSLSQVEEIIKTL